MSDAAFTEEINSYLSNHTVPILNGVITVHIESLPPEQQQVAQGHPAARPRAGRREACRTTADLCCMERDVVLLEHNGTAGVYFCVKG